MKFYKIEKYPGKPFIHYLINITQVISSVRELGGLNTEIFRNGNHLLNQIELKLNG